MRKLCWIIAASCFVTLNLAAAADREDDVAPLRNWEVSFDRVIHTTGAQSWQRVADALPSTATHFIAVTPCRLVDTRNPNGPFGGPIFQAGDTRSYGIPAASIAAACGVPAAVAYSLNFTIANYSGRGNLKAYPTGTTPPTVSTLNYGSGLPLGNAAIVPADASGSIDVAIALTAQPGPTNVIIDINGYFASGVVTSVTAGPGLTVTGTGDVTVGITPQGVGPGELAPNAVTSGAIKMGAVGAAQIADGSVGPVKLDATGSSSGQVLTSTGNSVAWQPLPGTFVRTVIVSPGATAVASGTALKNALANISLPSSTNPWLLKIEPGVYDLNGSALQMRQNVDIEGSGELATIITTTGVAAVIGVDNAEIRSLTIRNTGSAGQGIGILNDSASPRIRQVTVTVSGSTSEAVGISNSFSFPVISNVSVACSGGTSCSGITNLDESAPVISNSSIVASGPTTFGVSANGAGTVRITNCQIEGTTSVGTFTSGTTLIAGSELSGPAVAGGIGTNTCVGAYNSSFAAIGTDCN